MKYTACEQYDFEWEPVELDRFRSLWKNGEDIRDIAAKLRRKPAEVAFLVIDQADRNKIRARHGACWGEPKKFTEGAREALGMPV